MIDEEARARAARDEAIRAFVAALPAPQANPAAA
jgi:hypothetical protein